MAFPLVSCRLVGKVNGSLDNAKEYTMAYTDLELGLELLADMDEQEWVEAILEVEADVEYDDYE